MRLFPFKACLKLDLTSVYGALLDSRKRRTVSIRCSGRPRPECFPCLSHQSRYPGPVVGQRNGRRIARPPSSSLAACSMIRNVISPVCSKGSRRASSWRKCYLYPIQDGPDGSVMLGREHPHGSIRRIERGNDPQKLRRASARGLMVFLSSPL